MKLERPLVGDERPFSFGMMSRRLTSFLLLSLVIHALLLWLPGFMPSSGDFSSFATGRGRVEARLKLFPLPSEAPSPEKPSISEAPLDLQENNQGTAQTDSAGQTDATSRDDSPAVSPLPVLPARLPLGFDRDGYLPGDKLDVRPSPEQPIIIGMDDPQGISKDRGEVILMLFVGKEGAVDHVDIDSSDVPPDIAESLAAIFGAAKFRPGVKDDQPVKARMKILVNFEVR
jgi:hypothetical protein